VNKKEVLALIYTELALRGWKQEEAYGLGPYYSMNSVVTPFVTGDLISRRYGAFVPEFYVGVLDRDFERIWYTQSLQAAGGNSYAMLSYIVNIRMFDRTRFIVDSGDAVVEAGCRRFVECMNDALMQMPSTREQLVESLQENAILGDVWSGFSVFSLGGKHQAFTDYVRQLGRSVLSA
jgi:hypothetical protein